MTEPVSFAVHALPEPSLAEVQTDPRRKKYGRLKMLLVLAMCVSPVVASYFTYFVIKPQGRTNYSDLISPSRDLPADLPLTTLTGEGVPALSLRGQWLMVVVANAACDASCEKSLYLQRQLRETLGREKARVDKIWFVTDTGTPRAEVLQAISVGTPANVLRVPRDALAKWFTPATGQALDAHIYLIDPMGQWMMRVPPNPDPAKLKRDVEKLLRASASWDLPGR
jgi:cytochrome oxidase Cu insertion factor (SCO1/SenC/PrrC family)